MPCWRKQQGDQRGWKKRNEAELGDEVRSVGRAQIRMTPGAMMRIWGILVNAMEAIREFLHRGDADGRVFPLSQGHPTNRRGGDQEERDRVTCQRVKGGLWSLMTGDVARKDQRSRWRTKDQLW